MSSSLSKSLRLSSSLKMVKEANVTEKQGIVSILGSDCERTKAASLRRTLSADMSSKKWLSQQGFSPLKKIASSQGLAVSIEDSSSSEGEEEYEERKEVEGQGQFEIWSSIQEDKKKELEKPTQFDIWSSIICQKAEDKSEAIPPPYIHPLVKRSASSLSEKSLEVCTESLGSETGSDGFSSYSTSETGDTEDDKEEVQEEEQQQVSQSFDNEEFRVVKYNYAVGRKSPPRSFPPPLPSLSHREGASLRMRSHRDNGRLVLEAVSVPSQNNFHAQRQDGRLVLTFVHTPSIEVPKNLEEEKNNIMEQFDEEFENFEEYEEEKESENDDEEEAEEDEEGVEKVEDKNGVNEMRIVMEQAPKLARGVINVHRLALMMNKPMVIANRNPTWPNKFNEVVKFEEEEEDSVEPITLAQSLPPRPQVARLIPTPPAAAAAAAAAASFNAYDYCWRAKPMASSAKVLNPLNQQAPPPPFKNSSNKLIVSKNLKANEQQQGLFLRGNEGDYLVPLLRSCKEPRRSLLFWEPHCIATS